MKTCCLNFRVDNFLFATGREKILLLLLVPMMMSCSDKTITYCDYFQNGNKRMEISYKQGKLHGTYSMWFENGMKHLETVFENDSIVGNVVVWNVDGEKTLDVKIVSALKEIKNQTVDMESRMIYGWLKYEAEKLRNKIKQERLTYHKIKCLLFNTFV
jgi:antitoxin component YwqK of YwqJK toxin-antitoxin module